MISGQVFDIQRFSTHDGPGIRTTLFLKGCPLKCAWCHNPESQKLSTDILFNPINCVDCKSCENICPQKNARNILPDDKLRKQYCIGCNLCADVCNSDAIEISGNKMTVQAVMNEIEKDLMFYENSGGGVTLSGGEPLFQFNFANELLKTAKNTGIHTCIETSGFVSQESLSIALPYIDLFLYDIKLTNSLAHRQWTGVPFEPILENLKFIDKQNKSIQIRAIMIPEVNMNEKHYSGLAEICNTLNNIELLELIPYHKLGVSKLEKLGMHSEFHFSTPVKDIIEEVKKKLNNNISVEIKTA